MPLRLGNTALATRYRDLLLTTQGLTLYPASATIAEEAARLRAMYTLRTPSAVQIATALTAGAGVFVTNDARLAAIRDLRVLVLEHLFTATEETIQVELTDQP